MAYALFISRNDIIKQSPLQGSIDADRLLSFMRTAQEKYILDLLGTVLYYKLQDEVIAGTFPQMGVFYQDLMKDHIKPTLIWYAVGEYLPFSGVQFKSEGAVKHQSDQSVAPSQREIDYLKEQARQNADFYSTRMQNYLISFCNEIPEYLESVGNQTQIYPNQANTYFGGLNL